MNVTKVMVLVRTAEQKLYTTEDTADTEIQIIGIFSVASVVNAFR
jgi:hypothetical protein